MNRTWLITVISIYLCLSAAWLFLGSRLESRNEAAVNTLIPAVTRLWGPPQHQKAPTFLSQTNIEPDKTDILVKIDSEFRRKGFLWFSLYNVAFHGTYILTNPDAFPKQVALHFAFPNKDALYDDFQISVNGQKSNLPGSLENGMDAIISLQPDAAAKVEVSYNSRGLEEWYYEFSGERVKNFTLTLQANTGGLDFPDGTISPKSKSRDGQTLAWDFTDLVASSNIGIRLPSRPDPGPLASKISYFAPICLLAFFFHLTVILLVRRSNPLHPIHYFFIGMSFFTFHVLFSYLVDHLDINLSFALASLVSIFLATSYLRGLVNFKFALVDAGIGQLLFLVLFTYAFFYPSYTGLIITTGCIITLFIYMQIALKIRWPGETRPLPA